MLTCSLHLPFDGCSLIVVLGSPPPPCYPNDPIAVENEFRNKLVMFVIEEVHQIVLDLTELLLLAIFRDSCKELERILCLFLLNMRIFVYLSDLPLQPVRIDFVCGYKLVCAVLAV